MSRQTTWRVHWVKAIGYFQRALALWENADAELRPQVDRLRERLARLGGEPRPGGR